MQTLCGQALMKCGDYLHTKGRVMVPLLSIVEPRSRYSQCLFQGHELLKYTVFCLLGSYETRQG